MNRSFKTDKLIFITAYKALEKLLIKEGLKAVYVPMSIDVKTVSKYKVSKNTIEDRIIYFGNIVHNKVNTFRKVSKACLAKGYNIDVISIGKMNKNTVVSQKDCWKIASNYKYGIGVGRCAQELHALGVKTIIAGPRFGGLITNVEEYKEQLRTNMNGRYWTYNADPKICVDNIDKSVIFTTDIRSLNHAERVANFYSL